VQSLDNSFLPLRYRPELIDFAALDPSTWSENCQLAFDVLEQDLGISPVLTGKELAQSKNPDKLTMLSYLSQIYEAFRKEIPAIKLKKLHQSDDDLLEDSQLRHNCPPREQGKRSRNHRGAIHQFSRIILYSDSKRDS
jgi:hypothetical protein